MTDELTPAALRACAEARHLTDNGLMREALEAVRWKLVLCGGCGLRYRECVKCGTGVKLINGRRKSAIEEDQCGGHEDMPCDPMCIIGRALSAPPRAEALARKEKVNEDSTMPTLQRAAQDGVDTESRTRDDARHQRGEGTLSKDAGIPEVALTPHPILTNDELHAVDVALQAGSCPFSLRGKVIQALGLRAAALDAAPSTRDDEGADARHLP